MNVNRPGTIASLAIILLSSPRPVVAQEFLKLPDFDVTQVATAAETGTPESLYILASVYFKGKRTSPDAPRAAELLKQAAVQGLAIAQLNLGDLYFEGTRLPQNDAETFRWYQTAAVQGLPAAQYGLARTYAQGRGTPKNMTEAIRWYEQAAVQGFAPAQHDLGTLYSTEGGLGRNLQVAYKWLSLAAAQGIRQAVSVRDNLRASMSAQEITVAQQEAAQFKATPHYNTDELTRQNNSIMDLVKTITGKSKP